jgi:hypothetical protein
MADSKWSLLHVRVYEDTAYPAMFRKDGFRATNSLSISSRSGCEQALHRIVEFLCPPGHEKAQPKQGDFPLYLLIKFFLTMSLQYLYIFHANND